MHRIPNSETVNVIYQGNIFILYMRKQSFGIYKYIFTKAMYDVNVSTDYLFLIKYSKVRKFIAVDQCINTKSQYCSIQIDTLLSLIYNLVTHLL